VKHGYYESLVCGHAAVCVSRTERETNRSKAVKIDFLL
jgi:hypothetical protein